MRQVMRVELEGKAPQIYRWRSGFPDWTLVCQQLVQAGLASFPQLFANDGCVFNKTMILAWYFTGIKGTAWNEALGFEEGLEFPKYEAQTFSNFSVWKYTCGPCRRCSAFATFPLRYDCANLLLNLSNTDNFNFSHAGTRGPCWLLPDFNIIYFKYL